MTDVPMIVFDNSDVPSERILPTVHMRFNSVRQHEVTAFDGKKTVIFSWAGIFAAILIYGFRVMARSLN